MSAYPKQIQEAVLALCKVIEKYYPHVLNQKYDNCGMPAEYGCNFRDRMEMGLYIELLKAGEKFEDHKMAKKDNK